MPRKLKTPESTYVSLRFSDLTLANEIAKSTPPEGVDVPKPQTTIECSAPAEMFVTLAITFTSQVAVKVVGEWLWNCIKKRGLKKTRIERKTIPVTKRALIRLINEEIAKDKAREAQWDHEHKPTVLPDKRKKKRSQKRRASTSK